jgi:hypothetical protein
MNKQVLIICTVGLFLFPGCSGSGTGCVGRALESPGQPTFYEHTGFLSSPPVASGEDSYLIVEEPVIYLLLDMLRGTTLGLVIRARADDGQGFRYLAWGFAGGDYVAVTKSSSNDLRIKRINLDAKSRLSRLTREVVGVSVVWSKPRLTIDTVAYANVWGRDGTKGSDVFIPFRGAEDTEATKWLDSVSNVMKECGLEIWPSEYGIEEK